MKHSKLVFQVNTENWTWFYDLVTKKYWPNNQKTKNGKKETKRNNSSQHRKNVQHKSLFKINSWGKREKSERNWSFSISEKAWTNCNIGQRRIKFPVVYLAGWEWELAKRKLIKTYFLLFFTFANK